MDEQDGVWIGRDGNPQMETGRNGLNRKEHSAGKKAMDH